MNINRKYVVSIAILLTAIAIFATNFTYTPIAFAKEDTPSYYREKAIHNPDGIGKYYMNREIAGVMGHQAMMWLERPSREIQEQPDKTVEQLELNNDDVVADIGAGLVILAFAWRSKYPKARCMP